MAVISVIIPIYNVEKYLKVCLNSVINQTFKDIEIICADDGSTDNSLKILREYANLDSRIIVISKQNEGAGAARNTGMDIAKGEYLYFLDSDDFLLPDALEKMYNKIIKTNADICVFKNFRLNNLTETFEICHWENNIKYIPQKEIFNKNDIPENFFTFCNITVWTKLYKHSFLKENNVRFQNIKTCNDVLFNYVSLSCAKSITFLNEMLVVHRIKHSECLTQNRKKYINSIYLAFSELEKELKKRNFFEELETTFEKRKNSCYKYEISQLDHIWLKMYYSFKFYNKSYLFKKICRNIVSNIFSIKNKDIHKIIKILGIKFSYTSKKLIKRKNSKTEKLNCKNLYELKQSLEQEVICHK